MSLSYRIGKLTVCQIVSKTALAIHSSLKDPYMKTPSSKKTWFNISARFEDTLNFPHCIGAIDGNHIRIECPKMTLTYYYIYKGFYSIVLLAICGSNYCFTLLDLGRYGSNNDSGVLAKSKTGEMNREFLIIVYLGLVELLRTLLEYSACTGKCFRIQ